MSDKQTQDRHMVVAATVRGGRRLRRGSSLGRAVRVGMALLLMLGYGASGIAGPLESAGANGTVRFQLLPTPPQVLERRLDGVAGSIFAAGAPQGVFYAAMDRAGKARVWLLQNNAIVAELTAPASRDRMRVDWPGSFAFWLGGLPVVAISWKFEPGTYGIEDFAFWAAQGSGRFLGGLPGSTRSACTAGEAPLGKDCTRCSAAAGIPIDMRLVALEQNRARFVQQRAANWYYYFGAAAETFAQDYLLTANGLVPAGPARPMRNVMPLPQAQERVKGLLRDYFRLAKGQSRQSIAPEFLTCFEQLVDLSPHFGQGHYNVGCMHALLGNHQQAVASVAKAISLDPKYRKVARRDPDLASVRDDPELVRVLGGVVT